MTNKSKKSVTSEKMILKNIRLSFLRLDKPDASEEGQVEKYQGTALLDPSNTEHAALIKLIKQETQKLCIEAYGEVPADIKAAPLDRLPFGLADAHPKKKEYDGYKGMFYIYAANKDEIVDGNAAALLVGKFKQALSDAEGTQAPANPEKEKLQAKRQRQLAGARSIRSTGRQEATSVPAADSDDLQAHWDHFARKDKREQQPQ